MRRVDDSDPGMVNYTNVTLKMLVSTAYNVKEYQVSGPDWFDSLGFDVMAKLPSGAPRSQVPAMLQTLLAERFKLTLHRETKDLPVYALIVGKGGPKLKEVDPAVLAAAAAARAANPSAGRGFPPLPGAGPGRGGRGAPGIAFMISGTTRHVSGPMTMSQLANGMSNFMDRPVLDLTGLTGTYDVDLEWAADEREQMQGPLAGVNPGMAGPAGAGAEPRAPDHSPDSAGASIFAVIQEKLGLKLDPRKSSAEFLVIDHAEKVPTEN
jgi:uncharacterized protein (TIGR03435 family)